MQAFLRADPARELLAQAAECHRAGKLEDAEGFYRQILARDPKHVEALRLLALIAMQSEHYGQAEQLLKRAVEVAPDYLAGWIDLSRAQLERLDLESASASIGRAALLSPNSANVKIHTANVQARSGRHARRHRDLPARRRAESELHGRPARPRQHAEDDRSPGGGDRGLPARNGAAGGRERGLVEPVEPEDVPLRGRRGRGIGAPARAGTISATNGACSSLSRSPRRSRIAANTRARSSCMPTAIARGARSSTTTRCRPR